MRGDEISGVFRVPLTKSERPIFASIFAVVFADKERLQTCTGATKSLFLMYQNHSVIFSRRTSLGSRFLCPQKVVFMKKKLNSPPFKRILDALRHWRES